MLSSRGSFEACPERRSVVEHGPEDIHASPCECDDRLVVPFPLAPLAIVKCSAVALCERAESTLVEDAFEAFVASAGSPEKIGFCPTA